MKIIMAVVVIFGALWAVGYDPRDIKDRLLAASDDQAGQFSGRDATTSDDWGDY